MTEARHRLGGSLPRCTDVLDAWRLTDALRAAAPPLLFGLRLFDLGAVVRAAAAFVIFCLLSGVVYLINDIADRQSDRRHPLKARRPIACAAEWIAKHRKSSRSGGAAAASALVSVPVVRVVVVSVVVFGSLMAPLASRQAPWPSLAP